MITFQYQNRSVTLRSPDLGDTQDIVIGVQRKLDMMGRQHTWVPPVHNARLLTLTFRAMPREKMLELRDFLIFSAGHMIQYIDFKNQLWQGRISTELPTHTHDGQCNDSITLMFEGSKV